MNNDYFYGEVLTAHALQPGWQKKLEKQTKTAEGANSSCGDHLVIEWLVQDGKLIDAGFSGEGCVIARASTDMMLGFLVGKSLSEIAEILQAFDRWVQDEDEQIITLLPEIQALAASVRNPVRVKCATLAWHVARELYQETSQLFGETTKNA